MGRSQPGVGLWSPHFFVLHFFESGLTLNPHNKRHSFGLFISLYLCCVVDCINIYIYITWINVIEITKNTQTKLAEIGKYYKFPQW